MLTGDPILLIAALALLALVPLVIATCTAFLKIAIVLSLVRNALGVQQVPPNLVLYALALILTSFIMAPIGSEMARAIEAYPGGIKGIGDMIAALRDGVEPLRRFLLGNSLVEHRDFFIDQAKRIWPPEMSARVTPQDLIILVPAFVIIVLGGVGSFWGAVLAGLMVGIVVGLTGAYASEWSLLSMYLLLIALVTFRARGLLGRKTALEN